MTLVKDLIANLKEGDVPVDPIDPLGLREKLESALEAIGPPRDDGKPTAQQQAQHQVIAASIYLGHLTALTEPYNVDKGISAMGGLSHALGQLAYHMAGNRPRVPMVGLVAGHTLMPVAFRTDGEAEGYRQSTQTAMGNGNTMMHLVPVEISATNIDSRIHPPVPDDRDARPPAPEHLPEGEPPAKEVKVTGPPHPPSSGVKMLAPEGTP